MEARTLHRLSNEGSVMRRGYQVDIQGALIAQLKKHLLQAFQVNFLAHLARGNNRVLAEAAAQRAT